MKPGNQPIDPIDPPEPPPEQLHNYLEDMNAKSLIIIGSLGIIYDLGHRFGGEHLLNKLASPEQVLIAMIALFCAGIGFERLLTLRRLSNQLEQAHLKRIEILRVQREIKSEIGNLKTGVVEVRRKENALIDAVGSINTAEPLIGPQKIGNAAVKLVEECTKEDKIMATGQYSYKDELPKTYFKKIVEKVSDAKAKGGAMQYQVVLPAVGDQYSDSTDIRKEVFKEAQVEERLTIRRASNPMPYEILIGGQSVIIALLGESRSDYQLAVKITDRDFVKHASEWFKDVPWANAKPETREKNI